MKDTLATGMPSGTADAAVPSVLLEKTEFRWAKRQRTILNIPRFSVSPGEHIFISGPSGSGKSTLLGLVAGILAPTSGVVSVNGVRLNELSGAQRDIFRGDHIGFIFQQFNLIPYLNILENVLIPCRFSLTRSQRAAGQAGSPEAAARASAPHHNRRVRS